MAERQIPVFCKTNNFRRKYEKKSNRRRSAGKTENFENGDNSENFMTAMTSLTDV